MKVALVWSSPNMDGLTNSVAMQFKKGLENCGVELSEVHLNTKNIEHCKACGNGWGTCNKAGEVYADKLQNGFNMYY